MRQCRSKQRVRTNLTTPMNPTTLLTPNLAQNTGKTIRPTKMSKQSSRHNRMQPIISLGIIQRQKKFVFMKSFQELKNNLFRRNRIPKSKLLRDNTLNLRRDSLSSQQGAKPQLPPSTHDRNRSEIRNANLTFGSDFSDFSFLGQHHHARLKQLTRNLFEKLDVQPSKFCICSRI